MATQGVWVLDLRRVHLSGAVPEPWIQKGEGDSLTCKSTNGHWSPDRPGRKGYERTSQGRDKGIFSDQTFQYRGQLNGPCLGWPLPHMPMVHSSSLSRGLADLYQVVTSQAQTYEVPVCRHWP